MVYCIKTFLSCVCPANTKHLHNICTTSAQRLRRWSHIVQMLYKCFVFTVWIMLALTLILSAPVSSGSPAQIPQSIMYYWRRYQASGVWFWHNWFFWYLNRWKPPGQTELLFFVSGSWPLKHHKADNSIFQLLATNHAVQCAFHALLLDCSYLSAFNLMNYLKIWRY